MIYFHCKLRKIYSRASSQVSVGRFSLKLRAIYYNREILSLLRYFEESFLSQLHGTSFPACESEGLYLKFPPLPILHKTDLLARIIQIIYIIVTDFDLEKLKETANTGSNRQFDRNVTDPTWPVTPVMSATFFLDVTAFARKPLFCS